MVSIKVASTSLINVNVYGVLIFLFSTPVILSYPSPPFFSLCDVSTCSVPDESPVFNVTGTLIQILEQVLHRDSLAFYY